MCWFYNSLVSNLLQPHAVADADHFLDLARAVLDIEADAVRGLKARLGEAFVGAHRMILETRGRVVVTGMGKSGHVGNKIASTLASTGTPAFFMHPAEASHGDLGMITADDVVLAISYSGESDEIGRILPLIKRRGARVIAITGRADSTLAREADIHLDARVEKEACPLELAPTASTTAHARPRRRARDGAARCARLQERRLRPAPSRQARSGAGSSSTWATSCARVNRSRAARPVTCCCRTCSTRSRARESA
jgi:D-arabinose 5-phosphate isomerase GutQ